MVKLTELLAYLNELLEPQRFRDYCPNGLQVEGKAMVKTLVTGVTACQALIDEAIRLDADAILVHHGYFWRGENPCLVGMKQQRIRKLLQHDINLIAYHLPLDAHPIYGNNAQLAKVLEIDVEHAHEAAQTPNLLWTGSLQHATSGQAFAAKINECLDRKPLYIGGTDKPIRRIGWCTGAAQDFIENALAYRVDAYLSGEISERTVHFARENGLHLYAAGHHATERYGVQALAEHLEHYFGLQHHYVEIANPV